ncbi:unnamed protein product [Amoebophrya sp. A25]|nr:unnamed protein product [Amoebophrya sp. A25]|eukprot:GSA25T00010458001.1
MFGSGAQSSGTATITASSATTPAIPIPIAPESTLRTPSVEDQARTTGSASRLAPGDRTTRSVSATTPAILESWKQDEHDETESRIRIAKDEFEYKEEEHVVTATTTTSSTTRITEGALGRESLTTSREDTKRVKLSSSPMLSPTPGEFDTTRISTRSAAEEVRDAQRTSGHVADNVGEDDPELPTPIAVRASIVGGGLQKERTSTGSRVVKHRGRSKKNLQLRETANPVLVAEMELGASKGAFEQPRGVSFGGTAVLEFSNYTSLASGLSREDSSPADGGTGFSDQDFARSRHSQQLEADGPKKARPVLLSIRKSSTTSLQNKKMSLNSSLNACSSSTTQDEDEVATSSSKRPPTRGLAMPQIRTTEDASRGLDSESAFGLSALDDVGPRVLNGGTSTLDQRKRRSTSASTCVQQEDLTSKNSTDGAYLTITPVKRSDSVSSEVAAEQQDQQGHAARKSNRERKSMTMLDERLVDEEEGERSENANASPRGLQLDRTGEPLHPENGNMMSTTSTTRRRSAATSRVSSRAGATPGVHFAAAPMVYNVSMRPTDEQRATQQFPMPVDPRGAQQFPVPVDPRGMEQSTMPVDPRGTEQFPVPRMTDDLRSESKKSTAAGAARATAVHFAEAPAVYDVPARGIITADGDHRDDSRATQQVPPTPPTNGLSTSQEDNRGIKVNRSSAVSPEPSLGHEEVDQDSAHMPGSASRLPSMKAPAGIAPPRKSATSPPVEESTTTRRTDTGHVSTSSELIVGEYHVTKSDVLHAPPGSLVPARQSTVAVVSEEDQTAWRSKSDAHAVSMLLRDVGQGPMQTEENWQTQENRQKQNRTEQKQETRQAEEQETRQTQETRRAQERVKTRADFMALQDVAVRLAALCRISSGKSSSGVDEVETLKQLRRFLRADPTISDEVFVTRVEESLASSTTRIREVDEVFIKVTEDEQGRRSIRNRMTHIRERLLEFVSPDAVSDFEGAAFSDCAESMARLSRLQDILEKDGGRSLPVMPTLERASAEQRRSLPATTMPKNGTSNEPRVQQATTPEESSSSPTRGERACVSAKISSYGGDAAGSKQGSTFSRSGTFHNEGEASPTPSERTDAKPDADHNGAFGGGGAAAQEARPRVSASKRDDTGVLDVFEMTRESAAMNVAERESGATIVSEGDEEDDDVVETALSPVRVFQRYAPGVLRLVLEKLEQVRLRSSRFGAVESDFDCDPHGALPSDEEEIELRTSVKQLSTSKDAPGNFSDPLYAQRVMRGALLSMLSKYVKLLHKNNNNNNKGGGDLDQNQKTSTEDGGKQRSVSAVGRHGQLTATRWMEGHYWGELKMGRESLSGGGDYSSGTSTNDEDDDNDDYGKISTQAVTGNKGIDAKKPIPDGLGFYRPKLWYLGDAPCYLGYWREGKKEGLGLELWLECLEEEDDLSSNESIGAGGLGKSKKSTVVSIRGTKKSISMKSSFNRSRKSKTAGGRVTRFLAKQGVDDLYSENAFLHQLEEHTSHSLVSDARLSDFDFYFGEHDHGVRHGHGLALWGRDDAYYAGDFENDIMHGHGVLSEKNVRYEGSFEMGLRHGPGRMLFLSGTGRGLDEEQGVASNDLVEPQQGGGNDSGVDIDSSTKKSAGGEGLRASRASISAEAMFAADAGEKLVASVDGVWENGQLVHAHEVVE